jgi:hypothetical protein
VLENLSPKALAAVLRVREEVSRAALMAYSNSAFDLATRYNTCSVLICSDQIALIGSIDFNTSITEELHLSAVTTYQRVRSNYARAHQSADSNVCSDCRCRHEMAWQNYFVERSQGGQLAATTILVRAATSAAVREWATPLAAGYPPQVKAAIEKAYPRSKELCRS